MADKTNGKYTNIEMEMAIDEVRRSLPYLIENTAIQAKVLKARYDHLVVEGFKPEDALEIIKTRPLYE
ncbi:hypothetical protein NST70_13720 [Weizmannia sp. FSL K6-0777]|uniref:hypothetical protein n=1 Tax=Heyndrickxia TaxID=2837504 RepID=UPI002E1C303C|nr:hypothetical protein [Weizmannia sp. CD-2023]